MDQRPAIYRRARPEEIEENKPKIIKRYPNYRPIGFLVTIGVLTFLVLAMLEFTFPVAALLAMLTMLLNIIFN